MKKLLKTICIFLSAVLLSACGKEDYVYPNLITEMACLKTDGNGIGTQIVTDQGIVWHLQKDNRPDSLTADSTYRIISRFAPLNESEAQAYAFWKVIAPLPKPEKEYETIHTDPVSIQSIWQSDDYLNMVLHIKVKDQEHELSFIENGITANTDGTQNLMLTLFHNRKGDVEGFDQKFYLSVPLWHYQNKLNKGDQIVFQLNTYQEGMTSRTFIY
ncbi:MAG: hypothetical protein IKW32_01355 [Bacteroidaceae bacterium]|nr:hypothetical protein [Bacteroidaceae bacterium]